jgi:hypothetical protein
MLSELRKASQARRAFDLKVSLDPVLIYIALFQSFEKCARSAFYVSCRCNRPSYYQNVGSGL